MKSKRNLIWRRGGISLLVIPAAFAVGFFLTLGVSASSVAAPAPAPTPTWHQQTRSSVNNASDAARVRRLRHEDDNNNDQLSRRHRVYTPAPTPTSNKNYLWNIAHQRKGSNDYYSHISDVWLCLGMALTWTVWMLSNIIKSADSKERYQKDSVLVRGHVLHVSMGEMDSLGTGIPTYVAVIDYMLEKDHDSIQIRKHFATQKRLEEGFANVEILVLPEEPTNSVIREDWEKEMEDELSETDISLWNRAWCKRAVILLAAILIMTSVGSAVSKVTRLDPTLRHWGWISVCVGVGLMLPSALVVHRALAAFQRSLDYQSERAGIVIRGPTEVANGGIFSCDTRDVLDTAVCDDDLPVVGSNSPLWKGIPLPDAAGCYSIQFPPRRTHRREHYKKKFSDEDATLKWKRDKQQQQLMRQQQEQNQQIVQQSSSASSVSSISLGANSINNDNT
jgi:hypothetical protein